MLSRRRRAHAEPVFPAATPEPVEIVQRERTIIPHVTAVQVGGRVDFPNEDDVF